MSCHSVEVELRSNGVIYLARDFVETHDGLIFAVVANGVESGRVTGFLRYIRGEPGFSKIDTHRASRIIDEQYPEFRFHSLRRDISVHGVPLSRIACHYRPTEGLELICGRPTLNELRVKVQKTAGILSGFDLAGSSIGITGSALLGAHKPQSDIDFVVYGRAAFGEAQERLRRAVARGELDPLSESMWRDAYRRRGCSLTLEEFLWHEQRKFNKCAYRGTKVDLTGVDREADDLCDRCKKLRRTVIQGRVIDASRSFDYPAHYLIDHPEIREIISFTQTYAGQALRGETVEASGWIEQEPDDRLRLVIGTSREAVGEYIKVL